jgi:hypothetical protein
LLARSAASKDTDLILVGIETVNHADKDSRAR